MELTAMSTIRVPIDGLSRCLCPFLNFLVASKPRIPETIISAIARPRISTQVLRASILCQRRTIAGRFQFDRKPLCKGKYLHDNESWKALSIEQLHDRLRSAPSEREDAYEKTVALVVFLIKDKHEKPSLLHYNALIRVNADAELGSPAVVEELMEEMKQHGIKGDSQFYHNVLQVLAIHPDYILRIQMLEEMRERWIALTPAGYHFLILGLLRDHQYEMALTTFQKALEESIEIPDHICDIITYTLLNIPELDTALILTQSRAANHGVSSVSGNLWYYMLSMCASAFHYPGIKYIWQKRVEMNYTNPSDGICVSVLNTAARYHDPDLATEVIRVLANRNVRMDLHHYEPLLEAYIGSGDVKTAFRILCIMKKAKLKPDMASTRAIVLWLSKPSNEEHLNEAWEILQSLSNDNQVVPVAAGNVVVEAFIARERLDEALEVYKNLHLVCDGGPDKQTYELLFKGIRTDRQRNSKEKKTLAMFLASEMRALKVDASEMTYDRLILICLNNHDTPKHHADATFGEDQSAKGEINEGATDTKGPEEPEYEDAFRYYEEMKAVGGLRGWKPRPGTYAEMVRKCAAHDWDRASALMDEMESFGFSTDRLRMDIEKAELEYLERMEHVGEQKMGMQMCG